MYRNEIIRPAFLGSFEDNTINDKSIVKLPVPKKTGFGDFEIDRPSFLTQSVLPRSFVGFDALNAYDVKQSGIKVQIGDSSINKLMTITIKDPTDKVWIDEYKRRRILGESEDDIRADPPLGREQRMTTKQMQSGQHGDTMSENLSILETLIRNGFTESRDQKIVLGTQLNDIFARQIRTKDEIINEVNAKTQETIDLMRDANLEIDNIKRISTSALTEIQTVSLKQAQDVKDIIASIESKNISDADKRELFDQITIIVNSIPKNDTEEMSKKIDQLLADIVSLGNITKLEREALGKQIIGNIDDITKKYETLENKIDNEFNRVILQLGKLPAEIRTDIEEKLNVQLESIKDFSKLQYDEMKKVLDKVSNENESVLRKLAEPQFNQVVSAVKKLDVTQDLKFDHQLWTPEQVRNDGNILLYINSIAKDPNYPILNTLVSPPKPWPKDKCLEWASSVGYIDTILDLSNLQFISIDNAIGQVQSGIDGGQLDGMPVDQFDLKNKSLLVAQPSPAEESKDPLEDILKNPLANIQEIRNYLDKNGSLGIKNYFSHKAVKGAQKLILTDLFKISSINPKVFIDDIFNKISSVPDKALNFDSKKTDEGLMSSIIKGMRKDPRTKNILQQIQNDPTKIYFATNASTFPNVGNIRFNLKDSFGLGTTTLWRNVLKDVIDLDMLGQPNTLSTGTDISVGSGKRKYRRR